MGRQFVPYLLLLGLFGAMFWSLSFATLPPADFVFCNDTEIKTVDPALVTGQPEGRIIQNIFEGLTRWDPKDLHPTPGAAERWEISEDLLTYKFFLRPGGVWSDGSPLTAEDFVWSYRRFLHPDTPNQYAYQLWYVKGARAFSNMTIAPGDPVEVELTTRAPGALPFAAGEVLHGKLIAVEGPEKSAEDLKAESEGARVKLPPKTYTVEIDGVQRKFRSGGGTGVEDCKWVTLDFSQVGIKATDTYTLEIKLDNPTPYFISLVGFYPLSPVNRRCMETWGAPDWLKPDHIVTNGPFLLKERLIRDRIRLAKNPKYWNAEKVYLNTVDALSVSSVSTALNLYLTGEADYISQVPATIVPELLKQHRPDFHPTPYLGTYYYRLNTTRKPLDDVRVRKALSMALNRQAIVDTVTRAGQIPAYSFVPPGIAGYTQAECEHEDLAKAKQLLAEAGYPDGRGFPPTFEILFNDHETHKAIAELVQDQWKRSLGIGVKAQKLEWAAYLARTTSMDYWVSRAAWIGDYLDPNTFLDMFVTDGENNQTGWSNKEYDKLLEDAARERDPARRMEIMHRAEQILMDEMPIIPVYYYVSTSMVRPYVHGIYENIQDVHPLIGVWVDKKARAEFWAGDAQR